MFRLDGLWKHPDFVRLWTGQTVSIFGSLTTRLALPFTAVIYLDARAWQVALITTSDVVAGIAVGLFAGVWVDRLPRRPIMIGTDLARAAVVASVPVAALFGALEMPQLYVVAFASGVLTTFFDVAYQSYLPSLVREHELLEGNSKLAASASVSEASAFGSAGWLAQALTAPGAMAIDAVTFLVSAFSIAGIRAQEPPPPSSQDREGVRTEIAEGVRTITGDRLQAPMAASWMLLALSNGIGSGVIVLFITRDLGIDPGYQGMIYAIGGGTSLLGALAADRVRRRTGAGMAMVLGLVLGGAGSLLTAAAPSSMLWVAVALLIGTQIVSDPGITIYDINLVSVRQSITPARLMGRVNSAVRFSGLVAMLAGSLITVALVGPFGPRAVVVVSACSTFAAALLLLLSPVRRLDAAEASLDPAHALTYTRIADVTEEI